ncbi:membrane protein insertion efficiency factor YidD [Janthinobacterium sp. Mn2066]|uniref:membrane protein insertion efficiency factor YidD n=1 Tax=Janthinobacterium sp. Mn2066 TaxID=3395264 RepID=UPI003BD521CC
MQFSPFVTLEIISSGHPGFLLTHGNAFHYTQPCNKPIRIFISTLAAYSRGLALWVIRAYQRHLSPYKGFSCAYRVLTGRDSCSGYGYRAIARHGLITGWALLRRRLHACGTRHREHLAQHPSTFMTARHRAQAGFCDLPTTDCGDCSCDWGDALDLLSCDWPHRKSATPWRNSYTESKQLKRQQVAHRQKIARMQAPENEG